MEKLNQINCLNLCEILPYLRRRRSIEEIFTSALEEAHFESCDRVYVGTSFCGKYFIQQSDKELEELFFFCEEKNISVTLVIPTFSEGDLENGKKRIAHIVKLGKNVIDEFTANDVGVLSYLREFNKHINTGRLFMKDYRDPRYEEYFHIPWKPKMFTNYFKRLLKKYQIKSCEFDTTHKYMDFSEVPEDIIPAIHVPYTYQTVGRICEYASIDKEISKKFRPNDICHKSCADHLVKYFVSDGNMEYVKFGRTVYFKHPGFELKGLNSYRLIYFPIDMK